MLAPIAVLITFLVISRQLGFSKFYHCAGVLALVGHIIVAYFVIPILPYRWDFGNFHEIGINLVNGEFTSASTSVTSFGTFQGLIYTIFGVDPTAVSIVNSLLAVLTVIPVVYIARQLYGDQLRTTHGIVALVLFLPLPFLFLTLPMREGLTVFLVLSTLALSIHTVTKRDFWMVPPLIGLLATMYLLRQEWALVLTLGLLGGVVFAAYDEAGFDLNFTSLAAVGGALGGLAFVLFAETMYSFERVNAELTHRTSGGAAYLEGMEYSSWLDFLIAAPGRALYFQFAPFPLHVETVFHFLALTMTVTVIVFTIAAIRSLVHCEVNTVVLVMLLIVYAAGITGYGVINSNFGTNVRHRIPFDFLLIAFAAPVVQRWELTIREWLGKWPDKHQQDYRQQQKAQELD